MPSTRHRSPTISLSVAAYSFKFAVISFFDTWGRHHEEVVRRYTKFLRRARKAGEISTYQESELDTLAYLLIAARDYIYLYHLHRSKQNTGIPESVIRTYMQFVRNGLNAGPPAA